MILQIFALLASVPFVSTVFSSTRTTTIDTVFTCSQIETGVVWYEVGLILHDHTDGPDVSALVVAHDKKMNTNKLIANLAVTPFPTAQGAVIYQDQFETFKLQLDDLPNHIVGKMSLLLDGPNSLHNQLLLCKNSSQITYDLMEEVSR